MSELEELITELATFGIECVHSIMQHPFALQKPKSYWGLFPKTEEGQDQKELFDALLKVGYKRTPFQLVFPGQRAGIIRKMRPNEIGYDEHHIRFHDKGLIQSELEFSRYDSRHFSGDRVDGNDHLREIIESELDLEEELKEKLYTQFGQTNYAKELQIPNRGAIVKGVEQVRKDLIDTLALGMRAKSVQYAETFTEGIRIGGAYALSQGDLKTGVGLLVVSLLNDYLVHTKLKPQEVGLMAYPFLKHKGYELFVGKVKQHLFKETV